MEKVALIIFAIWLHMCSCNPFIATTLPTRYRGKNDAAFAKARRPTLKVESATVCYN